MGFKFNKDGECKVCGMHTTKFCDSCHEYICDEHTVEVEIENSHEKRVYCKECYDKKKFPKNAMIHGKHPIFQGN